MTVAVVQRSNDNLLTLDKYDDSLIFKLPGSGEKLEDCGQPIYIGHLDGPKWHWKYHKKSCHRKECLVCWPDWQKREALAIKDRVTTYFSGGYTKRRFPVHYVISPPQSVTYNTKKSYQALKTRAYKVAKQRGIDGGCLIFHERAIRYSDSTEYEFIHCSKGPHFHVIGDGWLSSRVKEFYLEDGWIVKNLRMRSLGSVYKTSFYILDHAAIGYPAYSQSINSPMSSVTWFGKMSYNKLKIQKIKGSDTIYCPICESEIDKNEWYVLMWINLDDPPPGEKSSYGEANNSKNGFMSERPITGWSGLFE